MFPSTQEEHRGRSDSFDPSTSEVKSKALKQHPPLFHLPLKPKASHTSNNSESSTIGVSTPSLHLRRSPPLAVLRSAESPTLPLSEFSQDYSEKHLSVINPVTGHLSFPASPRMSAGSGSTDQSSSTRSSSARSSLPVSLGLNARQSRATLKLESDKDCDIANPNSYRDTRSMEIIEAQEDGLVPIANPQFASLIQSRAF
jgi:hypothetical protein